MLAAGPGWAYNQRGRAEDREYRYSAILPGCENQGVLDTVTGRFADRELDYRNSSLTIVELHTIRTVAFRPNGPDLIPRRYCSAVVRTSDLVKRSLDYFIVEDGSQIGFTYGVEWCVSGLDYSYTYGARCSGARP